MASGTPLAQRLSEQLDWHWTTTVRPKLEGLSDDEYFWEPAPGCWSVRPRDPASDQPQAGSGPWTIDFAFPPPEPPPVTTVAWRLAHVAVMFGMRAGNHFGAPPMDYDSVAYAGTAADALAQLEETYAAWSSGVRALDVEGLRRPVGAAEPGFENHPMIDLVLHVNREAIHHCAEVLLLRDLYRARRTGG